MARTRFYVFVFLGLCVASAWSGEDTKPLRNADVVEMVNAGFDDPTIIKAVGANAVSFDTSVGALLSLKKSGVSQKVISTMLDAEAKQKTPASLPNQSSISPVPDSREPKSPHESGIYWLSRKGAESQLVRLVPSSYSQTKSGGVLASGMTFGMHKAKWKAVLPSPRAGLRVTESTPEFWFYFNDKPEALGQPLTAPSKPESFVLTRMDAGSKDRQLVVGQLSMLGQSMGTRPGDSIPLKVENISSGIYKVTPAKSLAQGEYCFVPPSGAVGFGLAGGTLYDFGID